MGQYLGLGDVAGKCVLVRSDLNVPLETAADGTTRITDDGRIRASVPTIKALQAKGARVVVVAHLGRPKGEPDPAYSLAPVARRLGQLLGEEVALATDTVGESAHAVVEALENGQVALLENVRFDPRETSKLDSDREGLAQELADLADAFVSDGFGDPHYALHFVAKPERKDDPRLAQFIKLFRSPEVKEFITSRYGKFIVPLW